MKKFYEEFCYSSGKDFQLSKIDPRPQNPWGFEKTKAIACLKELNVRLDDLQELLFAQSQHRLLIILQGMDTSGKDGVIRNVFEGVNPQGVKVKSFKSPSEEELSRDYLWRVHQAVPAKGEMVIFNRSHYEDVLIVAVHNFVLPDVWRKRYEHINEFEEMLVDEGVTILKFFLYISKGEQKERLEERIADPKKHWKFRVTDLKERKLWDEYQDVYEKMIQKTSTSYAPWYIVPADYKWVRNVFVASVIVDTLESFKMKYPKSPEDLSGIKIE